ncbi:MAG: Rpn family recombination-promoting nuclease/putative transposase [Bacteroidota bacterium]|jgi:hypothetical protein
MHEKIPYDQIYKQFFSDPMMVKALLFGFLNEDWVQNINFSTLKRLNTSYVTENLRERESDIIWRVQWNDEWLYLVILLEFQSTIDHFMVVRILSYLSLLYQDIIKEDKNIRKNMILPPVLPLVLYNGDEPWDAPNSFRQLIPKNLPETLKKYQPDFSCWILDERRYIIDKEHEDNIVSALFSLECAETTGEILLITNRLTRMLQGSEFDGLRRAFVVYYKRRYKENLKDPDAQFNTLEEVTKMLENNDTFGARIEARARREGELNVIKRLLTKRFGPLSPEQESCLKNMSAEKLLELSDLVLECHSIDEIINMQH